jgi:hypothetical protein
VADDRRFERDDGTAVGERVGDLGGELEGGHPSTVMPGGRRNERDGEALAS